MANEKCEYREKHYPVVPFDVAVKDYEKKTKKGKHVVVMETAGGYFVCPAMTEQNAMDYGIYFRKDVNEGRENN